jgi:hypothetical protein
VTLVATAEDDAHWAEWCQEHNLASLQTAVRHLRPTTRAEARENLDRRYLRMRWDRKNGVLHLYVRLPAADGAVVERAIDRVAEGLPTEPDGTYGSHDQRAADALVEMCSARIAEDADADRATVVVHVDVRELNRINGVAALEGR